LACGAFERHSSTGSYDCHSAGLVNKSLRDPIATAKSPVLSQNDSSEPWVVTPNNQEIPDLTTWSVFCVRKLVRNQTGQWGNGHRLFTLITTEAVRLERKPCPRS